MPFSGIETRRIDISLHGHGGDSFHCEVGCDQEPEEETTLMFSIPQESKKNLGTNIHTLIVILIIVITLLIILIIFYIFLKCCAKRTNENYNRSLKNFANVISAPLQNPDEQWIDMENSETVRTLIKPNQSQNST